MNKSSTQTSTNDAVYGYGALRGAGLTDGEQLASIYEARDQVNRDRAQVAAAADIPPKVHDAPLIAGGKSTSPELATLASRYIKFDMGAANAILQDDLDVVRRKFADDVRRLAASVLAQTE